MPYGLIAPVVVVIGLILGYPLYWLVKLSTQRYGLFELVAGTARSDPPRNPGIDWPLTWPGITNWAVSVEYFLPTQQLNQLGPIIDAAWPCAYTSYGFGCVSSVVFDARETAL